MLLYLVFSHYDVDGTFEMYYAGNTKTDALEAFTTATGFVFDATLKTGNLYFICFDTRTAPGTEFSFISKAAAEYNADDIRTIINNKNRAVGSSCLYTHVPFGSSTKLNSTAILCESCAEKSESPVPAAVVRSAYGNLYCAECWNNYIHPMGGTAGSANNTDGLVEYAIGIATDTYSVEVFTEEEKKFIATVWNLNKSRITYLPDGYDIDTIELCCKNRGLDLTASN